MSTGLPARAARLLQIVGINAIPIGGLLVGDWSAATALLIYWFETLLGAMFVVLRMVTHRRLTRKAGYWYAPLQDESPAPRATGKGKARRAPLIRNNYIAEFARTVGVFTVAHGLVLAFVTAVALKSSPDWTSLAIGMLGVLGFQGVSLAADLVHIGEQPFTWTQELARRYLGRVVIVQLAIIGGVWAAASFDRPTSFFAVFGVLKFVVDLAGWLPRKGTDYPETPPAWLLTLLQRSDPKTDPLVQWRALREAALARRAAWDEPMSGEARRDSSLHRL